MSVEQEIVEVASELYEEYRGGEHILASLDDALDTVVETEVIDAIALAYLIGLLACRVWYIGTRGEFQIAEDMRDFTDPGKGRTTEAHKEASSRVAELRETTRDEMEKLLTLGYMALGGRNNVSRTLIAPIANCIAEIFGLPSAEGHWEGMEDNVYKSLSKRCNDYIKKTQNAGGEDPFVRGETFILDIITTLYVRTSVDT